MTDRSATRLVFWPFFLVDALFLGLAVLIFSVGHRPLLFWEGLVLFVSVGCGAWSFLTPFLRRNDSDLKVFESEKLATTVSQIQNLEQISTTIANVAHHLKTTQEESAQTVGAAQKLNETITEEKRAFSEFLAKANDSEKNHLRLEVDKLRRAEMDWLQILIHILDHVFALTQAAERSGKPALVAQMQQFQNVCRDTARRIGLTAQAPDGQTTFDEKFHQVMEGEAQPQNGTAILETLAPGFSFQGRIVRRALVRVQGEALASATMSDEPSSVSEMPEENPPAPV